MTKIEIEPCKLKYSLTQGVFVVMQGGDFAAICDSEKVLWEWLDGCARKDISSVRIFLSAVDDFDKDEVTHLVFEAKRGDYDTYEAWAEWHGPDVFMEHWFDESSSRQYDEDFTRRYRRWKEVNAAPKREAITLIRTPQPVPSPYAVAAE